MKYCQQKPIKVHIRVAKSNQKPIATVVRQQEQIVLKN